MSIISSLKAILAYYKCFKTNTIVRLADEDACDLYASICSYRAQEAVSKYYASLNPELSWEETMELIFYSNNLQDTIKGVLQNTIMYAKETDFDFTQQAENLHFFQEQTDQDAELRLAKLFPRKHGIMLMLLLSFGSEQAYYAYLRREKGYDKPWKDFMEQLLSDARLYEPCFAGFKYWLVNLSFPESVWSNKGIIGLMNEAKERKQHMSNHH